MKINVVKPTNEEVPSDHKEEIFYNIDEQKIWGIEDIWEDGGHEWSSVFGGTEKLWNNEIFPIMKKYMGKEFLEIAPGFGRITQFLAAMSSDLIVVDLNPLCIEKTREKLGDLVSEYHINDGKSIPMIDNESRDFVFSFDSFVHMHRNVIREYVKEISRVLRPGGSSFIHHSNIINGSDLSFNNIAGRSNMTPDIMKEFVNEFGMEVVSQTDIQFSETTDIITIFKKP